MNRIHFFVVMIAFVCTASCSDDNTSSTDGGTDTDTSCPEGEYSGDFTIGTQSDVATLAGYTSISGDLEIECLSCTDLSELICLTSVGGNLFLWDNDALTALAGLNALTSVGNNLTIFDNYALPDCEACDLLDQLTSGPTLIDVHENLDDSCTPVPANCP